jgi:hypothetical protein
LRVDSHRGSICVPQRVSISHAFVRLKKQQQQKAKHGAGACQGRTGHITKWEKSHGAPLVWGPLRQSGAPQHHDLFIHFVINFPYSCLFIYQFIYQFIYLFIYMFQIQVPTQVPHLVTVTEKSEL